MIAKSALLILGMINESPKGAYEINKLLGQMNLKWWLTVSNSSIYVTIRNLETKDMWPDMPNETETCRNELSIQSRKKEMLS